MAYTILSFFRMNTYLLFVGINFLLVSISTVPRYYHLRASESGAIPSVNQCVAVGTELDTADR